MYNVKKNASKSKAKSKLASPAPACAICSSEVDQETDSPVTCGTCKQTAHRYCAGVSADEYSTISANSSPYTCLACFKKEYVSTIGELKSCISALKAELVELLSGHNDKEQNNGEWLVATRKAQRAPQADRSSEEKKPRWHSLKNLPKRPPSRTEREASLQNSPTSSARNGNGQAGQKEAVEGVRHVWGTLRSCSYRSVLSTLQKLTSVGEKSRSDRSSRKGMA